MKTLSLVFTLKSWRRCLRAIQPAGHQSALASRLLRPYYFLLLPLLAFFLGCSEKVALPEPTQDGAYTFGCKVNGKTWIPNGGGAWSGLDAMEGGFYNASNNTKLVIYIRAYKSNKEVIGLYIEADQPGTYLLNTNTLTKPEETDPASYGSFRSDRVTEYMTSSRHTGKITITKADLPNHVISGTFEFTAATPQGDVVKVTDGRFDYIYKP